MDSTWTLKLYGNFELRSPDGTHVPLANRKVQALVAILALNLREGMGRAEIGQILWPASSVAKRQENLRQTLARARKSLGAENLTVSRSHCRLADSFHVRSDFADSSLRSHSVFMPGFEGDWFDRVRGESSAVIDRSVLDSFLHVLEWLSGHDPNRMLALMRDNHGLTFGLRCPDRVRLLGRVTDESVLPGWKDFLSTGLWGMRDDVPQAAQNFRRIVSIAETHGDTLLAVQASSQLSLCLVWQNKCAEALEVIDWCCATASKTSDKELWATATQMKGNILIHNGQLDAGLPLIERAEQLYKDPIDSTIMRVLRGSYLASGGRRSEAARCLEMPGGKRETGHAFLDTIWLLATAVLESKDQDGRESIQDFHQVADQTVAYGNAQLTIIAEEELAKAYLRTGDVSEARTRAGRARKLRQRLSLSYTPWDEVRLSS